jgi:hypothetical protein
MRRIFSGRSSDLASADRGHSRRSLVEDIATASDWIVGALRSSGYRIDFSVDSLKEIDRFFDEHALNGGARPGGLLAENCGSRLFIRAMGYQ